MGQSDTEFYEYVARIDYVGTTTPEKVELFVMGQAALCKRVLMTLEVAEQTKKVHCHLYLQYLSPLQKPTIDKRFNRAFENRGGSMSKAICKEPEQYLTYMCKDLSATNKVRFRKGFTPEDILDYKARSYKKGKTVNIPYQVYTEIKLKYQDDEPSYEDIQRFVVRWYKHHRKAMTFSYMAGVVRFVNSMYREQDVISSFCNYMDR